MIKHIVMWTINNEKFEVKSTALQMKEKLESMRGKIEGLDSLDVGINENKSAEAYDVCLVTEHPTWEALNHYQEHPLHKEVAGFIGQVRKTRAVVDFVF